MEFRYFIRELNTLPSTLFFKENCKHSFCLNYNYNAKSDWF